MPSTILDTLWFTQGRSIHHFGIIKVRTKIGKIKYYIGSVSQTRATEEEDARWIAAWGSRINPKDIKEFFDENLDENTNSKA